MADFAEVWDQRFRRGGLLATIGMRVVEADDEHVRTTMPFSAAVEQLAGAGIFNGGALATLADATGALACIYALDPTGEDVGVTVTPPLLVQMNVHYLGNTRGPVTATSRLVHRGRTVMTAETSIEDETGRCMLLATSTHTVSTASRSTADRPASS